MASHDITPALASLLRIPLGVTNVTSGHFPKGKKTPDDVIVTHRYIFVIAGNLHYRCDGVTTTVCAGEQFLVPAWSRRQWWVSAPAGCKLLWCEFATEHLLLDMGGLLLRHKDREELEQAALERMLRIWPGERLSYEITGLATGVDGAPLESAQLLLEGELKASLARFWQDARLVPGSWASLPESDHAAHPEVNAALGWLQTHYSDPDALEAFYGWLPLSPNHFRLLFKSAKGETVQSFLLRLRMRHARYLTHETDRPLKQIAVEVGYVNPLFFSRQYRKFWGHSPRRDRRHGTTTEAEVSERTESTTWMNK